MEKDAWNLSKNRRREKKKRLIRGDRLVVLIKNLESEKNHFARHKRQRTFEQRDLEGMDNQWKQYTDIIKSFSQNFLLLVTPFKSLIATQCNHLITDSRQIFSLSAFFSLSLLQRF